MQVNACTRARWKLSALIRLLATTQAFVVVLLLLLLSSLLICRSFFHANAASSTCLLFFEKLGFPILQAFVRKDSGTVG